jgi:hypothetical protein
MPTLAISYLDVTYKVLLHVYQIKILHKVVDV